MIAPVIPFSLRGAPSLIEKLLPVQKLSAESYKEQMAVQGKTLTALGSYWKGRKPLILNKACILGCLLPATNSPTRDLQIFEMLMGMDDESFVARWKRRPKPKELLGTVSIAKIADYFVVEPEGVLPTAAPLDWSNPDYANVKISWRADLKELERRRLEARMLPKAPYREMVDQAQRPEEVIDKIHDHIWDVVNTHLGTSAGTFPELVEQLGIMRYGHRPRVADTFCGSGQIPFEAARLGCEVYASDLNPVACSLTWGAFHIIGVSEQSRQTLREEQRELLRRVSAEVDELGVETDGEGWQAKVFLYCVETRCPKSEWMVPLLPTRVVSKGHHTIVELVPDVLHKRYDILVRSGVTKTEFAGARQGTVRTDGRRQEPYLIHSIDDIEYRTKISTLRGDYRRADGGNGNRLRMWEKQDFKPRPDDVFQERLYAIQWMRPKNNGTAHDYEFRSTTAQDLKRERVVEEFISKHLEEWQANGWLPDLRIEPGDETARLQRERGWTHWHQLFNPRQLLVGGLVNRFSNAPLKLSLAQILNSNSRLSRWSLGDGDGRSGGVKGTFDNQALNTLFNYGVRGSHFALDLVNLRLKSYPLHPGLSLRVSNHGAANLAETSDLFVTDPPYGDAVKFEEILELFIAWLRKNPPSEFSEWVWDSRRSLAIKGEDEEFRRGMVASYKRMTECMPDNGIQVIMFTHQSGSIWADMANIVWASGLQVTAAWYVATETDSALREGSYVKGTVLLVVRKRGGTHKTTRDDLAWEIQEEVEAQVHVLTGLNQQAKGLYRDENVFEDADIQMTGYAAALRVLTKYAIIDGRDMTAEAIRPRVKGETTFVDGLIAFAVDTANQCLVPEGIAQAHWNGFAGVERWYLKLVDLEGKGLHSLDNYQNFAKAFKVRDYRPLMASQKANRARLKSAIEFGKAEMSEGSELHQSALRALLYSLMELVKNVDGAEVLAHLTLNVPDYYSKATQRELIVELADYLSRKLENIRPEEASAARILRDLVTNQRLG
jgi:putative DNA methylase